MTNSKVVAGAAPIKASREVKHQQTVDSCHLQPPPFTIKEIRDAIPAHCFERSVITSSMYVIVDITLLACFFYLSTFIQYLPTWAKFIAYPVYWFAQGAVGTGIWVLAHECGHQAFSKSKTINNTVGLILHSALLVPYHSWRITHSTHHKNTAHQERDQVFVPKTQRSLLEHDDVHHIISESPLVNLLQIVITLTVGWPFYLATNAWGQDYGRRTNHFEPSSPVFKPEHRSYIVLSDIGLVVALGIVGACVYQFGITEVLIHYVVPYLWVNFWLVFITYLQHTDMRVPHFRGEEWTFIRGALCTVDRNYGILNYVFHHIGDTHVAHHLFSQMPHYHAEEATRALKPLLGKYYLNDQTNVFVSMWKSWNTCHFVDDSGDVLWYKTITPEWRAFHAKAKKTN